MANSATALATLPVKFLHGDVKAVTSYMCAFDTVDTDLTVHTPAATNYVAVIGTVYSASNAHNLTVKFGTVTHDILKFGAFSGMAKGVSKELLFCGAVGEALKLAVSATVTNLNITVVEFASLTVV